MTNAPAHRKRGFSIVELIAVILILAIMVPATLAMVADAARSRHSAARASTAITLAASIAEHIIADAHTDDPAIGFPAFADPAAYLGTPETGLNHRIAWLTQHHADLGYEPTIGIGPLISANGATTDDPTLDLYRRITITIAWSDPASGPQSYNLAFLVGGITP